MSSIKAREIPVAITAVIGIIVITANFLDIPPLVSTSKLLVEWGVIISAFALAFVGPVNLGRYHLGIIMKRKGIEWIFSAYLIIVMVATYILGLLPPLGASTYLIAWYNSTQVPLNSAVYALTGFYVASAAFRAFRARNVESALLLIAGIFVMLKNAAVGGAIWTGFPIIGQWFMDIPSTAGNRGIIIASAIGLIAYGIRSLLGYEKVFAGGE